MVHKHEVMALLIKACPSFEENWNIYVSDSYEPEDEQLLYLDLSEFTRHLISLFKEGNTLEFPAVFDIIELLHIDGDDYVKEAATIGLLESIQNNSEHAGLDPQIFKQFLRTESLKWWDRLNDFWSGKTPRV